MSISINLTIKEGEKVWRLKNSLLQDKTFMGKINKVLKDYIEINHNGDTNPITIWEGAKAVLRGHITAYSGLKKKQKQQQQKILEQQIQTLEDTFKNTNELDTKIELKKKYKELDRIRTEEVEKLIAYTKQKYDDGGPNSLKILAYRLKKQSKTTVRTGDSSEILSEKDKIAEEFAKYYENFYKDNASDTNMEQIKTCLDKLNLKQVSGRKLKTLQQMRFYNKLRN